MRILGAQYGTVSDIEIMWMVINGLGLSFSLYNLWENWKDFNSASKVRTRNGRYVLALAAVKIELARTLILTILLTLGVLSMTLPDTPTDLLTTQQLLITIFFKWGLMVSAALIAYQSYLNREARKRVLDVEYGRDPAPPPMVVVEPGAETP